MTRQCRAERTERIERSVLALILLTVGGFAGAASFTHVHDWTMANSPPGTPGWFGWANAVISELIPVAALLVMRQRRRAGQSFGYPMFLILSAACLSLAAQLAVAKPGISGWLLSAVPALAFMGLAKLVLSSPGQVTEQPVTARTEVPVPVRSTEGLTVNRGALADDADTTVDGLYVDDRAPVRRVRARTTTMADQVAAAVSKHPDSKPAHIAAVAGVSESTARRHMRSLSPSAA